MLNEAEQPEAVRQVMDVRIAIKENGGHITRAMFGSRVGQTISSVAMWSLFLLALFVWPGLMMWVFIVFLIAGRGAPPLNDLTASNNSNDGS
jgi:hypothetical protein